MKQPEIKRIQTRGDFISFLKALKIDYNDNLSSWENRDIGPFLGAMASWVEDMDGFYIKRLEDSVTSQLLQEAELSPHAAGLIDNSLSIAGSMGGIASIRASQSAAFSNYRLPNSSTLLVMENNGWVLPKNGGGAFIHGR